MIERNPPYADALYQGLDRYLGAGAPTLQQRLLWREWLREAERIHLAVMAEPFLSLLLTGKKTIETRFAVNRNLPCWRAKPGDIVALKKSSGPVVGGFRVAKVRGYDLTPAAWKGIKALAAEIGADQTFWEARKDKKYVGLVWVEAVDVFPPFAIPKTDRQAWAVIERSQS